MESIICWELELRDYEAGTLIVNDFSAHDRKVTGSTRNIDGMCKIDGEFSADILKLILTCEDAVEENLKVDLTINKDRKRFEGNWIYEKQRD